MEIVDDGQRSTSIEQGTSQAEGEAGKEDHRCEPVAQTGLPRRMRMEGTLRANLLAAIASTRRLRGREVHDDTVEYWHRLLDYGRLNSTQPLCEPVTELLAQLENELSHIKRL